jgi:hypothetical protein
MILDSGAEIYIWIGDEASNEEKEKSDQLAKVVKMRKREERERGRERGRERERERERERDRERNGER